MTAFDLYSAYYDLLYRDKDYAAEADYIAALVKAHYPDARSILDMGCGTGRHAALLEKRGYEICGVDLSATMLEKAQQNHPHIPFHLGDARIVRLGRKFDVITSLFHVASYQTTNQDLEAYLETVRVHLNPGGLFIFDFWYGPGVLSDPPAVRVKRMENDRIKVNRIAEPTINSLTNVVDVRFQVLIENRENGVHCELVEHHPMRYLFVPEVRYFLECCGMELQDVVGWLETAPPGPTSWYACAIARNPQD